MLLFLWFDSLFEARAEVQKYFWSFLVQMKTLRFAFEIYCPLGKDIWRNGRNNPNWQFLLAGNQLNQSLQNYKKIPLYLTNTRAGLNLTVAMSLRKLRIQQKSVICEKGPCLSNFICKLLSILKTCLTPHWLDKNVKIFNEPSHPCPTLWSFLNENTATCNLMECSVPFTRGLWLFALGMTKRERILHTA